MKFLGPLSSLNGSRRFFVDLQNQLGTSELLTVATIDCADSDITITGDVIIPDDITTKSGEILPANKCVSFRAECTANKTALVSITINYETDQSNWDSTTVKLKVVPTIL